MTSLIVVVILLSPGTENKPHGRHDDDRKPTSEDTKPKFNAKELLNVSTCSQSFECKERFSWILSSCTYMQWIF